MSANIIGIDIGTGTIKVLAGKVGTDGYIEIIGSGSAPTAGYTKGVITDVAALAYSIRQAFDCVVMAANCEKSKNVYLGLGGTAIHGQICVGSVAPLAVGTITNEDVERACRAAVLGSIADDQHVLQVMPINISAVNDKGSDNSVGAKVEVDAYIITLPQTILGDLTIALETHDIHPIGFFANAIVAAEAFTPPSDVESYVFLDIGAGTTDIVYYRGKKKPCLVASLPLGGDYITNDLMQGLSVSRPHAEEIKRYYSKLNKDLRGQNILLDCNDYGTTDKQIPFDFLYDIVECRVEEIVSLAYDYFVDNHMVSERKPFVDKIYLAGGCSALPSFKDNLRKIFGVEPEIVHLDMMPLEYAYPDNMACIGILRHAAQFVPKERINNLSSWQAVVRNIKKMFKM
ncbi:MAG TPA: cell division FtsA domain-containing protein [Methylomusa anaerophila]|nr:cell division FtsA domain-containing protein [Methylomusa anaerophila]HML86913.1 cell division FtsA domain-containing protein [Methylomusa anaerophila]